ncbi:DUF1517 domain-containing protein [Oscillatoria sp. FACHB-1407]|uniref:DUF1517 domain-containing protein n=1 Tax=Oscillatoria sp. FACHB-1407 TaxID=2692847 RepID=UPI00168595F1|nr:DUF1517 domain-containing protein [Oscillatoria sp. FACHB-1407]MBD2464367.1 DUF1517 domain-containing protein [Oscillatoria sp. FACHB-1407]
MGMIGKLRLVGATVLSFGLIHVGSAHLPTVVEGQMFGEQMTGDRALATTGGRARGGSFDEPAPAEPIPSDGGFYGDEGSGGGFYGGGDYTEPGLAPYQADPYNDPYGYPNRRSYRPRGGYYQQPPVFIPIPNSAPYGSPYSSPGFPSAGIGIPPIFFIGLVALFMLAPLLLRGSQFRTLSSRSPARSANGEFQNDILTVTRLQIALLAGARPLQSALEQIATHHNLDSKQGLSAMLQETVLALLRSPQYWSHVRVDSETVNSRQEASRLFEQLSIEERSKVGSETLVNVGGQVQRQTAQFTTEDNPDSGYIVVTLLLGTGGDRPLLQPIHSTTELQTALQRLGAIPPNELLVFELLWTPQDPRDVLSRDELVSEYPTMTQL